MTYVVGPGKQATYLNWPIREVYIPGEVIPDRLLPLLDIEAALARGDIVRLDEEGWGLRYIAKSTAGGRRSQGGEQ